MSENSSSRGDTSPAPSVPTGLADSRFFQSAVDWELHRAERYWESFVIALIESESSLTTRWDPCSPLPCASAIWQPGWQTIDSLCSSSGQARSSSPI